MNIDLDPRTIVGDLTVHQKQVLEIAKAINKKATILVMDEPTAALGEEDTQSLFKIIRGLKEQGVGIIHISHRLKEVFEITDRVTVLRDGRKIDTVKTDHANMPQLISMMVGRELAEFYPKRTLPIGRAPHGGEGPHDQRDHGQDRASPCAAGRSSDCSGSWDRAG